MQFNTPKNIMNFTPNEVLDLVHDDDTRVAVNKKNRLKIIELVYSALGLDLTPDLLLALLNESQAELIVATAGAGKTSNSQVKILLSKLFRKDDNKRPIQGMRVLCLVFNKSNVEPMKNKQEQLVKKVRSKLSGFTIDSDINAKTMHSFCEEWKKQFANKLGIFGYTLLAEWETEVMLQSILGMLGKSLGKDLSKISIADLIQLYNLAHECLLPYEEMDKVQKFAELKTDKEILVKVFQAYDNMKGIRRKYDFIDMLVKIHRLLKSDEEARTFVQNYYQYIVADEFQDFTPIMIDILSLISGDKTPVLCIGDEDQCIYGFKGADIDTTVKFNNYFKNGKIYSLGVNRRCGENIVNASKFLVEHNTVRFPKEISAVRPGGAINYIGVDNQEQQFKMLVDKLDKYNIDDLSNAIVCYRDKSSSLKLSYLLDKADIPYYILSGYDAFSHELFGHVMDVLDILETPYDKSSHLKLYKCLGFKREEIKTIVERNQARLQKEKGIKGEIPVHFIDMEYGANSNNEKFLGAISSLYDLSNKIDTAPLSEIFPQVFSLLKTYYWNWKKQINKNTEVDDYFEKIVQDEFTIDMPYNAFMSQYNVKKKIKDSYNFSRTGVCLATFHVLKGLEARDVYIVDMCDDIFPAYKMIEKQGFDPKKELDLKEAEVRLFFVAMTRARDNLTMYYYKDNPSIYVQWLLQRDKELKRNPSPLDVFNKVVNTNSAVSNNIGLMDFNEDVIPASDELIIDYSDELKIVDEDAELMIDDDDDLLIIDEDEPTKVTPISKPHIVAEPEQEEIPSPIVTSSSFLDSILSKF